MLSLHRFPGVRRQYARAGGVTVAAEVPRGASRGVEATASAPPKHDAPVWYMFFTDTLAPTGRLLGNIRSCAGTANPAWGPHMGSVEVRSIFGALA